MNLNFTKLGNGEPILIVHGLFGSSDNWRTLGKKFSETNTVYLIDLRNHGRSPHSDDMNYEIMAEDLMNLIIKENIIPTHSPWTFNGWKNSINVCEKISSYF